MQSPFIKHIKDCKKRMRKLRKKIYKHNISHQKQEKKSSTRPSDLCSTLLSIFRARNLPDWLLSSLKSKRSIDIFSLKSLVVGQQYEVNGQSLRQRTDRQQKQVEQLYKQHCQRMKTKKSQSRSKVATCISSTQGQISQSKESQSQQQFDNSLSQNIFEQYERQGNIQAFGAFDLGESSLYQGQNIFNF